MVVNDGIGANTLIDVTGEMDPSGGSVPPGQNLPGRMEPGMNTNI